MRRMTDQRSESGAKCSKSVSNKPIIEGEEIPGQKEIANLPQGLMQERTFLDKPHCNNTLLGV